MKIPSSSPATRSPLHCSAMAPPGGRRAEGALAGEVWPDRRPAALSAFCDVAPMRTPASASLRRCRYSQFRSVLRRIDLRDVAGLLIGRFSEQPVAVSLGDVA